MGSFQNKEKTATQGDAGYTIFVSFFNVKSTRVVATMSHFYVF